MATQAFNARQQIRDYIDFGLGQLTPGAIGATQQGLYDQLSRQQGGLLNSLINQQMISSQMAGQSTIASLARQGLGNTGLGAALSGALQRGGGFQSNILRQRLQSELSSQALQAALGLQGQRVGLIGQAFGPIAQTALTGEKPWWQTGLEGAAAVGAAHFGRPPASG